MKEIILNGDRFLLTIPSVDLWNQVMQYHRNGLVQMKEWEKLCPSYLYKDSGHGIDIYDSNQLEKNKPLRYVINGSILHYSNQELYSSLVLKFRPVLIPLTRDGEQDLSFSQMEHTMLEGGYFELTKNKNNADEKVTVILGHAKRPSVWAGFEEKQDGLAIVDSCDEDYLPLRWWVCNGVLVCQQALIQIDVCDLFNMGLMPIKNTGNEKKG